MTEWGWNPDSFSAVGTVGALVAAVWVLAYEALARTSAQAERVVVWIDRLTIHDPQPRDAGLYLYIRNDSASPVLHVRVEYPNGGMENPVIAPGKEVRWGLSTVVKGKVEFTDTAGRRWRRPIGGGQPRRVWRRAPSPFISRA